MTDVHDKRTRSRNMSAIKSADTKPELAIRKALFRRGFRYGLNVRSLPGKPDIVLRKYRTCIFVNGCFWHMHKGCPFFILPKTRTNFWAKKLSDNVDRDEKAYRALIESDWKVIVIWECALRGRAALQVDTIIDRLSYLLKPDVPSDEPLMIE